MIGYFLLILWDQISQFRLQLLVWYTKDFYLHHVFVNYLLDVLDFWLTGYQIAKCFTAFIFQNLFEFIIPEFFVHLNSEGVQIGCFYNYFSWNLVSACTGALRLRISCCPILLITAFRWFQISVAPFWLRWKFVKFTLHLNKSLDQLVILRPVTRSLALVIVSPLRNTCMSNPAPHLDLRSDHWKPLRHNYL